MNHNPFTLVCFAVKEEAGFFVRRAATRPAIRALLTGMGPQNARAALRSALEQERAVLVVSAGFAGGLDPGLATGTVVFEADTETGLKERLLRAGAHPAQFHCAERVAVTVAQKQALRQSTGADAVEMESGVLRALCRDQGLPAATVRVILDTAQEDLPLDFNQVMTADQRLDAGKVALALAKAPRKIKALLHLQRQSRLAALRLADVLFEVLVR